MRLVSRLFSFLSFVLAVVALATVSAVAAPKKTDAQIDEQKNALKKLEVDLAKKREELAVLETEEKGVLNTISPGGITAARQVDWRGQRPCAAPDFPAPPACAFRARRSDAPRRTRDSDPAFRGRRPCRHRPRRACSCRTRHPCRLRRHG